MHNEILLPNNLQQHEITKSQLTNFSQMPHAAELLQRTKNLYLMGGSSISSNKPLTVFTGRDPEYSVDDYLNAVTANLIFNIGPELVITKYYSSRRPRSYSIDKPDIFEPYTRKIRLEKIYTSTLKNI